MNDWGARNPYLDSGKSGIQICPKCGCTMEVTILLQDGHNETEEYFCPNESCNYMFKARACITPSVRLIKYKD